MNRRQFYPKLQSSQSNYLADVVTYTRFRNNYKCIGKDNDVLFNHLPFINCGTSSHPWNSSIGGKVKKRFSLSDFAGKLGRGQFGGRCLIGMLQNRIGNCELLGSQDGRQGGPFASCSPIVLVIDKLRVAGVMKNKLRAQRVWLLG